MHESQEAKFHKLLVDFIAVFVRYDGLHEPLIEPSGLLTSSNMAPLRALAKFSKVPSPTMSGEI